VAFFSPERQLAPQFENSVKINCIEETNNSLS